MAIFLGVTLRKAHGNGAAALVRSERRPLDEIPPPTADDTATGLALARERGRPFQPGNRAGAGRKPALALLGQAVSTADPRYRRALRRAAAYRSRRAREFAVEGGGYLGAGPAAMLASSALALAASRVLHELASETLDPDLFVKAAMLADKSRQQELTAVDLAAREASARAAARGPRDPLADYVDAPAAAEDK